MRACGRAQRGGDGVAEDLSGTVLDERYRLVRQLGVGGMGTVYEAEQIHLDKRVAVKVLKQSLVATGVHLERFLREAKASSKIRHPNIVDVVDFGRMASGSAYYVMELLEGTDVAELLREKGRLPWPRVAMIVQQVLSALEAAHAHGVIHRDIKPANVFLLADTTGDGEVVKVLDFGIAKVAEESRLTRADEIIGTAAYMAPEQAQGTVTEQTDVYAVGVLMYKMLTGRVPFRGANGFETLRMHRNQPPPSMRQIVPDISPAVEALVLQALAKRPELRFSSTRDMEMAIEQLASRTTKTAIAPAPTGDEAQTLVAPVPPEATEVAEPAAAAEPEEDPAEVASTNKAPALARAAPPPPVQPVLEVGSTAKAPALEREISEVPIVADAGDAWPIASTLETTATQRDRSQAQRRRVLLGLSVGLVSTALLAVIAVATFAGRNDDDPAPAPAKPTVGIDKAPPQMPPHPVVVASPTEPASPQGTSDAVVVEPEGDDLGGDGGGASTGDEDGLQDETADDGDDDGDDGAAADDDDGGSTSTKSRPSTHRPPTIASVKSKLRRRAKTKCKGLGSGKVTVGFTIKSDGTTLMVVPQPPHGSDDLGRCVAKIVAGARFPKVDLQRETISVSF